MQTLPLITQLRDAWDDATEDGVLDPQEIADITRRIYQTDDGTHLAMTIIRGGTDTRRVRDGIREYETLHGPIDFQARKNARTAEDDPSAA